MACLPARGPSVVLATLLTVCTSLAQQPVAATRPVPLAVPAVPRPETSPPAPVRVAPTRPAQLWPVTRLRGADYVSVRDLAARFALQPAWTRPERALTLSDARVRFTFEANQRDFYFDGLRVFLGVPVVAGKDSLWLGLPDVIKVVAPLFRPADHLIQLPAMPPKTIVLDPGHGGIDPGTENKRLGVNEKTFALDVARRLEKILAAGGWRVRLTRTDDHELSRDKKTDLAMRDDLANKNQADLFLSIHFNSAPEAITGVETYSMAPQFMLSTGDDTGDEMTNVAYPSNRLDFANLLFGEKLHRAMIGLLKTPDRGFKRGRRAVLRLLDCPGALVECGYLSNDTETRRIATPEYRQKIAEALAEGVQSYAAALAALRPVELPAR